MISEETYILTGLTLDGERSPAGAKSAVLHLTVARNGDGYKLLGGEDLVGTTITSIYGEVDADGMPKSAVFHDPHTGNVRMEFHFQPDGDLEVVGSFLDHPEKAEVQKLSFRKVAR